MRGLAVRAHDGDLAFLLEDQSAAVGRPGRRGLVFVIGVRDRADVSAVRVGDEDIAESPFTGRRVREPAAVGRPGRV